jgi:ABC-2 type transport system ATP-binding protein
VIDRGVLTYDGPLEDLVRRVRPEKRVMFRLSKAVEPSALAELGGRVVSFDTASAVLQVPAADVNATIASALSKLPVQDLTVENAPLEEVMSELFSRTREQPHSTQGGKP